MARIISRILFMLQSLCYITATAILHFHTYRHNSHSKVSQISTESILVKFTFVTFLWLSQHSDLAKSGMPYHSNYQYTSAAVENIT